MDPPMRSSPTKSTYNRGERKSMTSSSAITSQSTPPSSSYYSPTEERDKVIIQSPISNDGHMVIYEPSPYEPSVLTTPEDIIDDGSKLVQFNDQNPKEIRKDGFDHCYVKVPVKDRLAVLFATLRRSKLYNVYIAFCSHLLLISYVHIVCSYLMLILMLIYFAHICCSCLLLTSYAHM